MAFASGKVEAFGGVWCRWVACVRAAGGGEDDFQNVC